MISIQSLFSAAMNAVKLVGSETPAFQQLAHQVAEAVGPGKSQDDLKNALAEARRGSDEAHSGLQDAARGGP